MNTVMRGALRCKLRRSLIGISGLIVLLFFVSPLYSFDFSISRKKAGIELTPEYNRTYSSCLTLSASGSLEFNERYSVQGGLSLWTASAAYELDVSAGLAAKLIRRAPLYLYLSYMFNTLPEYETNSHTVLPLIGFKGKYAGITLGPNLRFSSFFDEPVIFESILAFEGYVNFYNSEEFRIGLRCANFNDYAAGNFGVYYLSLNSRVGITKLLSLTNDLELYQTGSAGLSSVFYGVAYKAGLIFTW
ncbi:hypothetical protein LQZ19_02540 [Treponema primitia]|uniref:hypothetical protein n=1 Tax=Treponema primitia TaxID=88058 RepID=UPI00397FC876